eukprot:1157342-Pelagomonas_calceolata.AAC.5
MDWVCAPILEARQGLEILFAARSVSNTSLTFCASYLLRPKSNQHNLILCSVLLCALSPPTLPSWSGCPRAALRRALVALKAEKPPSRHLEWLSKSGHLFLQCPIWLSADCGILPC